MGHPPSSYDQPGLLHLRDSKLLKLVIWKWLAKRTGYFSRHAWMLNSELVWENGHCL